MMCNCLAAEYFCEERDTQSLAGKYLEKMQYTSRPAFVHLGEILQFAGFLLCCAEAPKSCGRWHGSSLMR